MKNSWVIWILLFVNLVICSLLTFYVVRGGSDLKVRYVNTVRVFNDFSLTKELQAKVQTTISSQQATLDSLAIVIRGSKEDEKRKKSLEELYDRFQRSFDISNQRVSDEYDEQVWNRIKKYSADYSNAENIKLIIGSENISTVIYGDSSLDATADLIKYMNDTYAKNP